MLEKVTHWRSKSIDFHLVKIMLVFLCIFINSFSVSSQTPQELDRSPVELRKQRDHFFDPKRKQETDSVMIGYHIAIDECQSRFKWKRWNCTLPSKLINTKTPVSMTKFLPRATKETAYMYAMVAAGVTYSLMRSCARGENNRCPCVVDKKIKQNKTRTTCKEDLAYAFKRAKRIIRNVDVKDITDLKRKQFNIKNFKIGYKTMHKELPKVCKCHGMSGTCQQKTCWRSTPQIGKVSESLKKLYDHAVKVRYDKPQKAFVRASNPGHQGKSSGHTGKSLHFRNRALVYLEDSPDYCQPNLLTGHKGTLLRYCDPDNMSTCQHLCENCGYRTVKRLVLERNCKKCRKQFKWCCSVSCGSCPVLKAQCRLPM